MRGIECYFSRAGTRFVPERGEASRERNTDWVPALVVAEELMGLLISGIFLAVLLASVGITLVLSHRREVRRRQERERRRRLELERLREERKGDSENDPLPAAIRAVQRDPARAARVVSRMLSED